MALVRKHGGRVTLARRQLLRILFEGPDHHRTAADLALEVRDYLTDVNLSTIYRNLEELERLGVVVQSHLGPGAAVYHISTRAHGHLVCEACGTVFEVPDDVFRSLAATMRSAFGFAVNVHHLAVPGCCRECKHASSGLGGQLAPP